MTYFSQAILFMTMKFFMVLGSMFRMVFCMQMMRMSNMRVVSRLVVLSFLIVLGRFVMVFCCFLGMMRGMFVMFGVFVSHKKRF